jgi:hypothetical protein
MVKTAKNNKIQKNIILNNQQGKNKIILQLIKIDLHSIQTCLK